MFFSIYSKRLKCFGCIEKKFLFYPKISFFAGYKVRIFLHMPIWDKNILKIDRF